MFVVSLTRLRVRCLRFLPIFLVPNEGSVRVIKTIEGFVGGKELIDKNLTFWTVTLWASDTAMKVFRGSGAHKKATRNLPNWCDEAACAHCLQEENTLPAWDVLHEILLGQIPSANSFLR